MPHGEFHGVPDIILKAILTSEQGSAIMKAISQGRSVMQSPWQQGEPDHCETTALITRPCKAGAGLLYLRRSWCYVLSISFYIEKGPGDLKNNGLISVSRRSKIVTLEYIHWTTKKFVVLIW